MAQRGHSKQFNDFIISKQSGHFEYVYYQLFINHFQQLSFSALSTLQPEYIVNTLVRPQHLCQYIPDFKEMNTADPGLLYSVPL